MSDMHAAIGARLDELEALAKRAYDAEPGAWALHHNRTRTGRADEWEIRDYDGDSLAWVGTENDARLIVRVADPATVLRGLAEDRDILRRHQQVPLDDEDCRCGWVLAECPELLSLARRHGVQP